MTPTCPRPGSRSPRGPADRRASRKSRATPPQSAPSGNVDGGESMPRIADGASRATDKYLKLIRAFPLRPIRDEGENEAAIEVIAGLGRREPLDADERDYLDVLVGLVERFESAHYPPL